MEFTLFYQGVLSTKNKRRIVVVNDLRREFHNQLKMLLKLPPLVDHPDWFREPFPKQLHKEFNNLNFVCLVSNKLKMYVDLEMTLLAQYKNRNFKDIDNKVKIIGDGLQIPNQKSHIPIDYKPAKEENPLICLLSDDRLIYKLKVDTDYILNEKAFRERDEMICLIKVKIKGNKHNDEFKDLMV